MTNELFKCKDNKVIRGAEVKITEKLFHHIMSNGPILKTQNNELSESTHTKWRKSFPHSASDENRSLTAKSKRDAKSDIPALSRNRSADQMIKRQMASECKLHSFQFNSKWTTNDRLQSFCIDGKNVKQREIILEPPGHIQPKRGLSGSKLNKNTLSPRLGFLTQRNFDLSESNPESFTPSSCDRPQSQIYGSRTSIQKTGADAEEVNKQLKQLRWNSSDQGRRMQREISYVSSSRFVKRASEVVSYRVDPMYLMSGCKIDLQNRYSVQDGEIRKMQEMAQLREKFNSNLENMKRHHLSSASSSKGARKKQSPEAKTNLTEDRCKDIRQPSQKHEVLNEQPTEVNDEHHTDKRQSLEATNEEDYGENLDQNPETTGEDDYGKNTEDSDHQDNE